MTGGILYHLILIGRVASLDNVIRLRRRFRNARQTFPLKRSSHVMKRCYSNYGKEDVMNKSAEMTMAFVVGIVFTISTAFASDITFLDNRTYVLYDDTHGHETNHTERRTADRPFLPGAPAYALLR